MSRFIDADKLLIRFMDYICHDFACSNCKARYYPSGICRVDKMLHEFPTADVVPYSMEDGVLTLDLSGIREKIHGCEIKIYFGSDWGGETDEQIH